MKNKVGNLKKLLAKTDPTTRNFPYRIGISDELNSPLWHSEGEVVSVFPYLQLLGPQNYGGNGVFGIYISAIEFNIVP